MNRDLKEVYVKQMLLPKEELALQTMELMADKMILEDNWNKLKVWLEEEIKYNENWYKPECKEYIGRKRYPDDTVDSFDYVLEHIKEIEGGMNE